MADPEDLTAATDLADPEDLTVTTDLADPEDLTVDTVPVAPSDLEDGRHVELYNAFGTNGAPLYYAESLQNLMQSPPVAFDTEFYGRVAQGGNYQFPDSQSIWQGTQASVQCLAYYPHGGLSVYWKTALNQDYYAILPKLVYYGRRDHEAFKAGGGGTYYWDSSHFSEHHAWFFDFVPKSNQNSRFRYWIVKRYSSALAKPVRVVSVHRVYSGQDFSHPDFNGWGQNNTNLTHSSWPASESMGGLTWSDAWNLEGHANLWQVGFASIATSKLGSLWEGHSSSVANGGTAPGGNSQNLWP